MKNVRTANGERLKKKKVTTRQLHEEPEDKTDDAEESGDIDIQDMQEKVFVTKAK